MDSLEEYLLQRCLALHPLNEDEQDNHEEADDDDQEDDGEEDYYDDEEEDYYDDNNDDEEDYYDEEEDYDDDNNEEDDDIRDEDESDISFVVLKYVSLWKNNHLFIDENLKMTKSCRYGFEIPWCYENYKVYGRKLKQNSFYVLILMYAYDISVISDISDISVIVGLL